MDTDVTIYTGILALLVNIAVAVVATGLLRALGSTDPGVDATEPEDYHVEAGDPGVEPEPATAEEEGFSRAGAGPPRGA